MSPKFCLCDFGKYSINSGPKRGQPKNNSVLKGLNAKKGDYYSKVADLNITQYDFGQ
jgi:hypothetical protein